MSHADRQFITALQLPNTWSEFGTMARCNFDINQYDDDLFSHYAIDRPDSLSRAVAKRKAEYLAGRICAQELLQKNGVKGQVITGKNREPLFPSAKVVGSITHTNVAETENIAFCFLADSGLYHGVGIDVEGYIPIDTYLSIKDKIINSNEEAIIKSTPLADNKAFTLIFSIKESFYKAAFGIVQRFFGFSAIEIQNIDLPARRVDFVIKEQLHPELSQKCSHSCFFYLEDDYLYTLCTVTK